MPLMSPTWRMAESPGRSDRTSRRRIPPNPCHGSWQGRRRRVLESRAGRGPHRSVRRLGGGSEALRWRGHRRRGCGDRRGVRAYPGWSEVRLDDGGLHPPGLGDAGVERAGDDSLELLDDTAEVGSDHPEDERRQSPSPSRRPRDVVDQSLDDQGEARREVGGGRRGGGGNGHDPCYDTIRTVCEEESDVDPVIAAIALTCPNIVATARGPAPVRRGVFSERERDCPAPSPALRPEAGWRAGRLSTRASWHDADRPP